MKTTFVLLSAILIGVSSLAAAQDTSGMQGMKMDQNMPMKMGQKMPCMHMKNGMQMGKNTPCKNQTAQGKGVVEAVNQSKGTVTIKHQAITSIGWPAMTMTFKADPPSLLQSVKVGEKVNFTLQPAGMNSTVTAISPANETPGKR